tara:strand:- start:276 stop:407 length:132 start_codon:yes stop_codon:yes gene_type:complete
MSSIITRTVEVAKEFALLRSPIEVYIFVGGVWLLGVAVGSIVG